MNRLLNSVQRLGRFLRPARRSRHRGQSALVPSPRFIDCAELEDRTMFTVTPLGIETLVNTATANTQETFAQAVASDAAGNYVAVWSSQLQDGTGWGVYAQRFNAAGAAQGSEFRVNTVTAADEQYASVAMDASGDFAVVWTTSATADAGVRVQRYDASGVAQGGETQVNTYTTD